MLNDQRASTSRGHHGGDDEDDDQIRDIHALTPPPPPPPANRGRTRGSESAWETSSHRSSSLSMGSDGENFTTMSREFNALVIAGSTIGNAVNGSGSENNIVNGTNNLAGIGEEEEEEEVMEETNPLAIVPDNYNPVLNPVASPRPAAVSSSSSSAGVVMGNNNNNYHSEVNSVHRVKKEEVETKITAWQTAKIAKINNRFKREDAVIKGWEDEQVQKSTSWMKKVERKLEEKRARAMEKMQNEVAKARRKAEERRASAEAKRGTKVARVLEISNLMRAVGRPPVKRSFF